MKLSQMSGKPLLSLYSASTEGVVTGILLSHDLRRAGALKIEVIKKGDVPVKYCPLAKVHSVSPTAVTVKNSACLTAAAPALVEALGLKAVDTDGNDLGTINEIETQKTAVAKLITPKAVFAPSQVVSLGEFAVVNLTGKKMNLAPSFPRLPRAPKNDAENVTVGVSVPSPLGEKKSMYSFLEGKTLTSDFVLGSAVLKKGDSVTKESLSVAEKEGKLIALALACR